MKDKPFKYLILIILILFFILSLYFSINNLRDNSYTDPDTNVNYFFIKLYAKEGSLKYPIELADNLSSNIYIAMNPRSSTQYNKYMVPKSFLGIFIYLGNPLTIDFIYIYTPLILLFFIIIFFLVTKELFKKRIGLICALFLLLFPPFIIRLISPVSDSMLSYLFLYFGLLYFIKYYKFQNNKLISFTLSILFFGLSVFIRPTSIIYIFPLILFLIFKDFKNMLLFQRKILMFIIILILLLSPLLILNYRTYGNFLEYGYSIQQKIEKITFNPQSNSLLEFDLKRVYSHIILNFNVIIIYILFSLMGLILYIKDKNFNKKYILLFFFIFIINIIYFGSRNIYGIEKFSLSGSFLRYILPLILFILIFFILYILYISKNNNKFIILFFILIIVVINILISINIRGGLWENIRLQGNHIKLSNTVMNITENNSIIITLTNDKLIFPKRIVVIGSMLSENVDSVQTPPQGVYYIYPSNDIFAEKINEIFKLGRPLYIIKEGDFFNDELLDSELFKYNLKTKLINSEFQIYQIQSL